MKNKTDTGNDAEQLVINLFMSRDYIILGQKIKNKFGEIDILCYKNNIYYIIEVKYRSDLNILFYSIDENKKQRCLNAFYEFCNKNNQQFTDYKLIGAFVDIEQKVKLIYL